METKDMARPETTLVYWFKARGQTSYHAYRSRKFGEKPVCGEGPAIIDVSGMEIGGDHSKCCLACFLKLNGLNRIGRLLGAHK